MKPVVIEAFKWGTDEVPQWWIDLKGVKMNIISGTAFIPTPKGTIRASLGDYIIQGISGEVYPIKEEIFLNTYEPA